MVLVMSSMLWTSTSQAFFFCSSMGGGNRYRDDYYPVPPPYGAFGAAGFPDIPYSPVMRQPPLTPIAPIETRNMDYPVQAEPVPKQHIFH
jgi:hypothetical protein